MVERTLDEHERYLASWVFGKTLHYSAIRVSSKLGVGNRAFTSRYAPNTIVHMGPQFFANIFGYVFNPDLSVAEGVTVRAYRSPHALEAKTETDEDGFFLLKGLRAGAYRVEFEFEGYTKIKSGLQQVDNGELMRVDAALGDRAYLIGFKRRDMRNYGTLMHELTHAWQGQHGKSFFAEAGLCQIGAVLSDVPVLGILFDSNPYGYTPGADWDDLNVEQQAQIVEDWYKEGCPEYGARYPYIRDHILKGNA